MPSPAETNVATVSAPVSVVRLQPRVVLHRDDEQSEEVARGLRRG